jgi:hypothetical protein
MESGYLMARKAGSAVAQSMSGMSTSKCSSLRQGRPESTLDLATSLGSQNGIREPPCRDPAEIARGDIDERVVIWDNSRNEIDVQIIHGTLIRDADG